MRWESMLDAISGDVIRLDYVTRFSSIPATIKETVSTHSYWVTVYSAMIHNTLCPEDNETLLACLMAAIVHDIPEGVSGDFVRPFKYSTKALKTALDEAELKVIDEFDPEIKALFSLSESLIKPEKKDYVKRVVKAADFISLYQFMRREWLRGNREIKPFYEKMIFDLHSMGLDLENRKTEEFCVELSDLYFQLTQSASEIASYRADFLRRRKTKHP
jgi:5'-deoxynucleotidase YfbR-like HD superfamily hydrolase